MTVASRPLHRRRRTDTPTPCDDTTCEQPATRISRIDGATPSEWRHCDQHEPWIVAARDGRAAGAA